MTVPKLKWWVWAIIVLGVLGVISALMGGEADEARTSPEGPLAAAARLHDSRTIAGQGTLRTFAVRVTVGTDAEALEGQARDLCSRMTHCLVMGWIDRDLIASAMPMTDREAEGLAFHYTLNRSSGMDRALWDCAVFSDIPADRCLSS
ncbi:hypothetical protein [Brevundimonas sp.]|uniref:hypothetical protein n=1 Tax=Brevundimonas sp. TaxID=1871086 RepID=UPI0039199325